MSEAGPQEKNAVSPAAIILVLLFIAVCIGLDVWAGTGVVVGLMKLLALLGRLLH